MAEGRRVHPSRDVDRPAVRDAQPSASNGGATPGSGTGGGMEPGAAASSRRHAARKVAQYPPATVGDELEAAPSTPTRLTPGPEAAVMKEASRSGGASSSVGSGNFGSQGSPPFTKSMRKLPLPEEGDAPFGLRDAPLVNVVVAAHQHQGLRPYQEDTFVSVSDLNSLNRSLDARVRRAFFGVFDGHGGVGAAAFARANLPQLIADNARLDADPEGSLVRAIAQLEAQFTKRAKARMPVDVSGTCVCVALLVGNTLVFANVGDCRAVLVRRDGSVDAARDGGCTPAAAGTPTPTSARSVTPFNLLRERRSVSTAGVDVVRITRDHKPDDEAERARVEAAGGAVRQREMEKYPCCFPSLTTPVGPHRVVPGWLAVARAIGDVPLKDARMGGMPGLVIATPETFVHRLSDRDVTVVFASDGLWDHVAPEDPVFAKAVLSGIADRAEQDIAVKKAKDRARRGKGSDPRRVLRLVSRGNESENVAEELVALALRRCRDPARKDNVTVLCVTVRGVDGDYDGSVDAAGAAGAGSVFA